jgi:hypothetical protein
MRKKFDFVEYWANYILDNPGSWREQHTKFLDDQIKMANNSLNKLRGSPEGREKLILLKGIKNKKLISQL